MKKITLSCVSLLAISGLAFASTGTPCDGFEVKIKNNTPDNLLVTKLQLTGAELNPHGLETIPAHTEQAFTVNHSADHGKMKGVLEFHSISIPVKKAHMEFDLKNKHLICHHKAKKDFGDYHVSHSRRPGKIKYTIG